MNEHLVLPPKRHDPKEICELTDAIVELSPSIADLVEPYGNNLFFAVRWVAMLSAMARYQEAHDDTEIAAGLSAQVLIHASGVYSFIKAHDKEALDAWEPFRIAIQQLFFAYAEHDAALNIQARKVTQNN